MNLNLSRRPGVRRLFSVFLSLLAGVIVGVILHQLVYRFSLPAQPFVYAAF